MKNKLFLTLIALFIFINSAYAQYTGWQYLNHESGGYVTEIIPVKYIGQLPASINNQVLYARTDVGGIYRSSDNGQSWTIINNYFRKTSGYSGIAISDLSIQGLTVKDNGDGSETVLIATGHYPEEKQPMKCIFKSTNSGQNWISLDNISIQSPGILFRGNEFPVKIGGPCITYDPNNPIYLYAGGRYPSTNGGGIPYLYKSEDNGQSWNYNTPSLINFHNSAEDGECIICISIKPGNAQHIWVGTSKGILFTSNAGTSWNRVSIPDDENPFVKRILLQKTGSEVTGAFITWANDENGTTGIGRMLSSNNWVYEDLTENFSPEGGGYFSALSFVDDNENSIITGLHEGEFKITTDFGTSWSNNPIYFQYSSAGGDDFHNFPNHQDPQELTEHMYDGLSSITRNPNFWSGQTKTQWYLSGGAGGRKTSPNFGVDGLDFGVSKWQYTVKGQTMPVMYDIVFHNLRFNNVDKPAIFMPMSDWTMSWEYQQNINFSNSNGMIPTPFKYDRKITEMCNYDTYISNVTRILFNPDDPNMAYCVGGSVYDYTFLGGTCSEQNFAGFYKRKDNDGSGNNFYIERVENSPFLNIADRAIVDAVIFKSGNDNIIISLVGLYSDQTPPDGFTTGVFKSTNEGDSWTAGTFDVPCMNTNISTQAKYSQSKIRGLYSQGEIDGSVGALFDGNFSLCYADNGLVYLWLESREENNVTYGGGLFKSTNNGDNWAYVASQPHADYYGSGSLKYLGNNKIGLAVEGFDNTQHGLYRGSINTSNGEISTWEQLSDFISAKHLDYLNGSWAVWGKKGDDVYNQIYKSTNDGVNWTRIPEQSDLPLLGQIHSLRIRPAPYNNELWVSTSGQGVFIYKNFQQVCVPPITNHYVISGAFENDCDIVVEDGGWLEITNPPTDMKTFKMGAGKSIIVEPGGKLTCENTIFEGINGAEWGGIIENNSYAFSVDNCEIKNAPKCISLSSNSSFKVVKNTTFWVPQVSGESYGINALYINRCYFASNSFVLGNSNAIGININLDPINNDFSEEGDNTPNSYLINSNTFSGGSQHLVINGLGGYVPPFWIMYNHFYPTYQNTGTGVWARKVHGYFKNNIFYDTDLGVAGFGNAITFTECYLQMLENTVKSSQTNLNLLGTSSINMQPADDGQGQYFWNAGRNKFYLENTGNASESNINFADGCVLAGDKGENCFYLPLSVKNNKHITGFISNGNVLNMTMNYWQPTPPIYELYGETMESLPYSDVCFGTGPISTNYDVMNIGFGINDTLYAQQRPSGGGGRSSSLTNPKYIFTECLKKKRAKNFSEAMVLAKQIINSYDTSKYFLPALDELFSEYQLSDTVKNQQARYALFNSLALYLNSKINQYQTNSIFVDKAYRYYLMCLTKMKNYQEAITGYENIIINHSDPVIRLTASWDRASVILLMNSNSGGSEKEFYDDDFGLRFEELAKEKPIHEIANKTYSTRKQDYSQKLSMGVVKKADIEKKDKIEKRVSVFTASSKEELDVKINADIKALLGLKTTNTNSNSLIPLTYNLSQNYPNPFNPTTKIAYDIPRDAKVKLVIYDILGREMKTLVNNEFKTAGKYIVEFNGSSLSSGVYFYRLQVEGGNAYTSVKKMVLLK